MIRMLPALPLCFLTGIASAETCAPANAPRPAATVQAMYAAAMAGNKTAMAATFAPGFYAFDGGRRYSADQMLALLDVLKAMHRTMTWTVNDAEEQVTCDTALVTWYNRGTATDAGGTRKREWLESAVERWKDGAWKLVFFHSTPVADTH